MEARRRQKNKIVNNIRETEICIKRSNETITRIRKSSMGEVYTDNQIKRLKDVIIEKTELLEKLQKDRKMVMIGGLDDEIDKDLSKAAEYSKKVRKDNIKTKKDKKDEKQGKKDEMNNYWKGIIASSRAYRQKKRDIRYGEKYLGKVLGTLPAYMQKNLSEMPNNKGYIWRGVHFYGELREQRGPRVMFEKKRGGILVIHENTDREYRRYEKKGRNRKQLVYRKEKTRRKGGLSMMDYVN